MRKELSTGDAGNASRAASVDSVREDDPTPPLVADSSADDVVAQLHELSGPAHLGQAQGGGLDPAGQERGT